MSENTVYSLARSLQHSHRLNQDVSGLFSGLQDTFEKEYLLKIRSAADAEKAFALSHPPREVRLLRALSAYADEGGRQQIDRMTQSLLFLHTLQHIQQSVADFSEGEALAARSTDGTVLEEPPSAQSARAAGLLLALALSREF